MADNQATRRLYPGFPGEFGDIPLDAPTLDRVFRHGGAIGEVVIDSGPFAPGSPYAQE